MTQFYETYEGNEIVSTMLSQLGFSTFLWCRRGVSVGEAPFLMPRYPPKFTRDLKILHNQLLF